MQEPPNQFKRLFVAITPPEATQNDLREIAEEIKGVRWMPRGNVHLTLKFIGEVDQPLSEAIKEALAPIRVQQFFLQVAGVGFFPPRGLPKVVWVGLENGHPRLFQLQKRVEDALFNLGIEPEKRAYQPHLTVARCAGASQESVRQLVKRHAGFAAAPFKVAGYSLYHSDLRPDGAIYAEEAFWPFPE